MLVSSDQIEMSRDEKTDLLERFLATLKENGNNITGAAKTLGISRQFARGMARRNGVTPNDRHPLKPAQKGMNCAPHHIPKKHARDDEFLPKLPGLLAELRSLDKVARALKTSRRTVTRLMLTHNILMPRVDKDADLKAKIPALLAQYGSQARVAVALGVSDNTVRRVMRQNAIAMPDVAPVPKAYANKVMKAHPERYANLKDRLPQLFAEHKSQAAVAKAVGVDKKTIARALKATGYKPPQVMPGPQAKSKQKGSTPFNGGRVFRFMSSDGGEPVTVQFCADPKMEKARQRLLQSGSQNDDAVWEVHQAYGVPLRDVYRLRYENRERAKGRM